MTFRLHHGALSPFVRKVMICVHEKDIAEEIEIVPTKVGATVVNEELMALNPIGKIPTLITEGGEAIYDSLVIIDHLDHVFPDKPMIPTEPPARLQALRQSATADGLIVAGVLAKGQMARPDEQQWAEFRDANWAKAQSCAPALANDLRPNAAFDIGHAATAAALGWLDARAPEIDWRASNAELATWFENASTRPSLELTRPGI